MSSVVLFDTSIFIDQLRSGRHQAGIHTLTGLIRTSSVVLSELWRRASSLAERRFLQSLERNHPILVPTWRNWIESGQILSRLRNQASYAAEKLRNLHFDVLIALTACSSGARLITSNRGDFELIAKYVPIAVEIWP